MKPHELIQPKRSVTGISAMLLPVDEGQIDWSSFESHLERTVASGLIPAVNMDTGYVNLLSAADRTEVLRRTAQLTGNFVAGVFIDAESRSGVAKAYLAGMEQVVERGGMPIIFQSRGLTQSTPAEIIDVYREIAAGGMDFLAFELSPQFAPFGRVYDLATFEQIMAIPECIGIKHSSLSRRQEWDRLALRNRCRAEFRIFTGNDLAIDMIQYGSDYLLGLSTFAPDFFATRDRYWEAGDSRFYELNDLLQYLGQLSFRHPVPAYKHSAAQFLKLRGWIRNDQPYPGSATRPESDVPLMKGILDRLMQLD